MLKNMEKLNNMTCGECKYHKNMRCHLPQRSFIIVPEEDACRHFEQKPKMTNGDKLAGDRECMAAVIIAAHGTICPFCIYYKNKKCTAPKDKNCFHGVVAWLEQEAKDE